jgi:hypothetical protein
MTIPSNLPYLGRDFALGEDLRTDLANVLSEASGVVSKSSRLKVFLTAAIALIGTVDTSAPTVSTITHDVGYNIILVNYNEGLDPEAVPAAGTIAITSPTRTVTKMEVQGASLKITYSGVRLTGADTPLVAYTQPAADQVFLQNASGVVAASFTAAAVAVSP